MFISFFLTSLFILTQPLELIKSSTSNVAESSGIYWFDNTLYIIGDSGQLGQLQDNGSFSKKRLDFEDSEGIYVDAEFIYVVEERSRKVILLERNSMKPIAEHQLQFFGRMNRGFEGITFNPISQDFLLVTEENPCQLVTLDSDFQNPVYIDLPIPEASDITFHNNFIWILSDVESKIYKFSSTDFRLLDEWETKIINAEGLTFTDENLIIVSDNLEKLYYYEIPK